MAAVNHPGMKRLLARPSGPIERFIDDDGRYICGVCDDRFPGAAEGAEHVLHAHPEYRGVMVFNSATGPCPRFTDLALSRNHLRIVRA